MFDINAILWLTAIAFVAFYWIHALRTKEIANKAAEQHCEQMQVQFLDQTVFLKKIGIKRNSHGHLSLLREYYFEFTVSGEDRYVGRVFMLGKRIESLNLDPHRLH
ncbi:MAG: DUF3301 domain-containing protein [Sphingobacteriales bacterium]|nr:MAG: DUF3301 domain-containing protein [Sphingobacteriales bacterium]